MDATISVKPDHGYLFIKVSGIIINQEEHRLLTERVYFEIKKHRSENTIVDVSEAQFPKSLEFLNDIVEFYCTELPPEVKYWKIAVVDESDYWELGKYWEFMAHKKGFTGYKVFPSMREAQAAVNG
jgi:hypothetical protein